MRYNKVPEPSNDLELVDVGRVLWTGYSEGVSAVFGYVQSINAYPKLVSELEWAIERGLI